MKSTSARKKFIAELYQSNKRYPNRGIILPSMKLLLPFVLFSGLVFGTVCDPLALLSPDIKPSALILLLANDSPGRVRRGIDILKAQTQMTPEQKAGLWKEMAEGISSQDPDWHSYPTRGSRQEFIFQGEGGHFLVIDGKGAIFTGRTSHLIRDGWVLDYKKLNPIQ